MAAKRITITMAEEGLPGSLQGAGSLRYGIPEVED